MASSLWRFRNKQKLPNKIECTYTEKSKGQTKEQFPTFTKDLYMSVFPMPIPDRRCGDERPVDHKEFLTYFSSLGSGRIGRTYQAVRKDFTKYACTKAVKKDLRMMVALTKVKAELIDYVDAVRAVEPFLIKQDSPFLLKVLMSFRSRLPEMTEYYYILSEYSNSFTSLCHRLQSKRHFSEVDARFYFMEMGDALRSVHQRGVVFRRLCMCNILLEPNGHVRVSPYGLCDQNLDCGQPCNMLVKNCGDQFYASPEVVFGVDARPAADYWSLGVMLYQMITGKLPFIGRTLGDLGKAITEADPVYPDSMSGEAKCLIKNLLHKDYRRRMGLGPENNKDMLEHPFFDCISWDDVKLQMEPPYIPKNDLKSHRLGCLTKQAPQHSEQPSSLPAGDGCKVPSL